jgi:hypothetical protein
MAIEMWRKILNNSNVLFAFVFCLSAATMIGCGGGRSLSKLEARLLAAEKKIAANEEEIRSLKELDEDVEKVQTEASEPDKRGGMTGLNEGGPLVRSTEKTDQKTREFLLKAAQRGYKNALLNVGDEETQLRVVATYSYLKREIEKGHDPRVKVDDLAFMDPASIRVLRSFPEFLPE